MKGAIHKPRKRIPKAINIAVTILAPASFPYLSLSPEPIAAAIFCVITLENPLSSNPNIATILPVASHAPYVDTDI